MRCLEERYCYHKSSSSNSSVRTVGVFQLYEASRTVDCNAGASVSLSLPDTDLETHLRSKLPRYWQLEVEAKGAGPICFLVPVYRSVN